jgi:hypothetical protein
MVLGTVRYLFPLYQVRGWFCTCRQRTIFRTVGTVLTIWLRMQPSVEREASYYLDAGHWFLSLYNDDSEPRQVCTATI